MLGMKKLFELHDYTKNMKDKIVIFCLKGKEDIWREYVKWVRDINIKGLSSHAFKRLFRKKYLSERYYESKAKEFYELKIGSVKNEEYTTKFQELLRYVSYLKVEKAKAQRFVSGLPLAFKDQIENNEPWSVEEVIGR